MKIFIISWFGEGEIREKRAEYHRRQIAWAKEKSLEIYVLNQEYKDDEFIDGVTYIGNNQRFCAPGKARNILLDVFYKSDDDYAIFADNDSEFKEISNFDFLEEFEKKTREVKNMKVGLFSPIDGRQMPFNKEYNEKKDYYDENLVFLKNTQAKGSLNFIANFKKILGKEIFFSEEFEKDGELIPKEDKEFAIQIIKSGLGCYLTKNLVLREWATNHSTWTENEDRTEKNKIGDALIKEHHPEIPVDIHGNIDYSAYSRKPIFKKHLSKIEIPIHNGIEGWFE